MSELMRVSFTIEKSLYERMERLLRGNRHGNRSEFLRDLIRARLVSEEWKANEEAIGTITLVFDHAVRYLSHKLTDVQHEHHAAVLATTHVHLDKHLCAEMVMVRGRPREIEEIAERLGREKGVLHAGITMSSTGKKLI